MRTARDPVPAAPVPFPFVSQIEPNGRGYRNCGPACLAMVLARFGRGEATREAVHRLAEELRGRRWTAGSHTTLAQLGVAASRRGLTAARLASWPAVDAAVGSGLPVVLLVRSGLLAPPGDATGTPVLPGAPGARHFVLLIGHEGDQLLIADPERPAVRWFPSAGVQSAAAALGKRPRALSFAPCAS